MKYVMKSYTDSIIETVLAQHGELIQDASDRNQITAQNTQAENSGARLLKETPNSGSIFTAQLVYFSPAPGVLNLIPSLTISRTSHDPQPRLNTLILDSLHLFEGLLENWSWKNDFVMLSCGLNVFAEFAKVFRY